MVKKLSAFALIAAMLLSVACRSDEPGGGTGASVTTAGNSGNPEPNAPTNPTGENPTDERLTLEQVFDKLVELEFFDPPYMVDIEEERLEQYHVNPEDAESFIAKEAAISAIFVQLIVIEATDGKVNDVHNAMLAHQEQLLDDAFYPQGLEAAAASIVNIKGNFVYLICDERADEIEKELVKLLH
jgi:hypothetical protein